RIARAIERLLPKRVLRTAHFAPGFSEFFAARWFAVAEPFENAVEVLAQPALLAGETFAAAIFRIARPLSFAQRFVEQLALTADDIAKRFHRAAHRLVGLSACRAARAYVFEQILQHRQQFLRFPA